MAKSKSKEVKKEVKKVGKLKITKPNGRVITRESGRGLKKIYESKQGWKVEEV